MRDGKNFRRWFKSKRNPDGIGHTWYMARHLLSNKPEILFGEGMELCGVSESLLKYIESLNRQVPIGDGIVHGPQLALIEDDPNRKEYILPSEILDKL